VVHIEEKNVTMLAALTLELILVDDASRLRI